jgi:hypothetical protein
LIPQGFKYQAVARDASGKPYANTDLAVDLYLKDGGLLGTIFYQEEHDVTTSDLGIFNLNVGQGAVASGSFEGVPWQSGLINLMIDLSLDGGASWIPMGESPLLSVPYALYAGSVPPALILADSDGDTRINLELSPDEDIIRFSLAGSEEMTLRQNAAGQVLMEFPDPQNNIFIGSNAGIHNTTDGIENTALGFNALSANTTGDGNTAMGQGALMVNDTGYNNTAIGKLAQRDNYGGQNNTALGMASLLLNSEGENNTAVGVTALVLNQGSNNCATGAFAMEANTYGEWNTAVGTVALQENIEGNYNTALGANALGVNTIGSFNVGVGFGALANSYKGSHNTAVGMGIITSVDSLYNSSALGYNAVINANNKVRLGNSLVTAIEGQVAFTHPSDGRFKYDVNEDIPGLDFITRLRPVSYRFNKLEYSRCIGEKPDEAQILEMQRQQAEMVSTGFIAQEVDQAARDAGFVFDAVHKPQNDQDTWGLAYSQFVVPLVKAIQEQQVEIERLQQENQGLQQRLDKAEARLGEVDGLKNQLAELKAMLRPE